MAVSRKSKRARLSNNKRRELYGKVKIENSKQVFETLATVTGMYKDVQIIEDKIKTFVNKKQKLAIDKDYEKYKRKKKSSGYDFRDYLESE
eukprot:GAHX01000322.1.p1 GENE.GAHX01000322.1~~GAHX01000322.1.p1  ORF type:complete len:106 (+),score=26.39 GAHX01000322.1:47-319(+)